jgi:hypothetical protein
MGGSWYMDAPGDRRFNWNKQPTYVCPLGDPLDFPERVEGEEPGPPVLKPESATRFEEGAMYMACDPILLAKAVRKAHHSFTAGRRRDESGALTDECAVCGARMNRLGFRAWEDVPRHDDKMGQRVAARLGMDLPRKVLRSRYFRTKKQAEAWARAGAKKAKEKAVA